ncbi:HNH endonuclease signature motif containing protein [Parvibaculaceae bacterium PLY_AMNH_Bact1]|nr:HNH endonuclease signature motif containing protein [Parvibaculaceae bacterium PLY_AMNH_Bact1]
MPTITQVEIERSYSLAKDVRAGLTTLPDARDLLVEDYGMNVSSAYGYVRSINTLFHGGLITRTLNTSMVAHLLNNVSDDLGFEIAANVIQGLWLHVEYYEKKSGAHHKSLRALLSSLSYDQQKEATSSVFAFNEKVSESSELDSASRMAKIERSRKRPKQIIIQSVGFARCPHIVAERLERAGGICDHCEEAAPFKKQKDNEPFLEVHHVLPLAAGGEDVLENTIALCPNCHRESHLGVEWKKFRKL